MATLRLAVEKKGDADLRAVVQANTTFALDLYAELKGVEGNLFFSPYSISTALAMTHAGARGNTAREMAETLHFTVSPEQLHRGFASLQTELASIQEQGYIQLRVANSLWPQIEHAFLESYLSLVKETYGALVAPVDFGYPEAASEKINTWVEGETAAKIRDLVPPSLLGPLTVLVLVNAIYFKGDWACQFDPDYTRDAPFWRTSSESVEVPMMEQRSRFGYWEDESLQVLDLPYTGDSLSMTVLLPRRPDGLAELEGALTAENLDRWTDKLREREVLVHLPRLKMSRGFRLEGVLKSMGMTDAFGAADFSGMDGTRSLAISTVIHKAYIDLNEEGTEAAAATAVVALRGVAPPPPTFRADHPFLLMIRENATGSILFLGRVANPLAEAS